MKCDRLTCTDDAVVYEILKNDDVYKWCQICHDSRMRSGEINKWTLVVDGKKEENSLTHILARTSSLISKEEYIIISVMKS